MKNYIFLILMHWSCMGLMAQSPAEDLRSCFRQHPDASALIQPYIQNFEQQKKETAYAVQQLIDEEGISVEGGVPGYENLASVVRIAASLARLDSVYDTYFASSVTELTDRFVQEKICVGKLSADAYREELAFYLEEEIFHPQDNYASLIFARKLGFRSVRVQVNEKVDQWLAAADSELSGEDPALSQLLSEDYYWPLMNSNWDLNLRNPEAELLIPRNLDTGLSHEESKELAANFTASGTDKKVKLKAVLLFIFDNWKDIKDILNWLSDNVTYDCHGVTKARQKETVEVETALSPSVRRKVKYLVFQRGVLFDGKETKTHIKGITHCYRKKKIGWGKDRTSSMGISYCTFQWNTCESIPWMADGSVFMQAPNYRFYKAYQDHKHPYALTVRDSTSEFLTFYFYFGEQIYKTVYLLGSGSCM